MEKNFTLKKIIVFILFAFIFSSLSYSQTTYTVGATGQDFTTIQAAIDDGSVVNGDTIRLVDAVFTEADITFGKDIILTGNNVVVQANAVEGVATTRVFNIGFNDTVKMIGLIIRHGVGDYDGGGIYNEGHLIMEGCTVINNVVIDSNEREGGGGIYNSWDLTIISCQISNNESGYHGGGILNDADTAICRIFECKISENIALEKGGGIANYNADTLLINYSSIHNNQASQQKGGGIYNGANSYADVILEIVEIKENYAPSYGEGIYATNGIMDLDSVLIENNTAAHGGGIFTADDGDYPYFYLTNVAFVGNNTTVGGGGAINAWYSYFYLYECSFYNNYTVKRGGAINAYDTEMEIFNTTFSGNTALLTGGAINFSDDYLYLTKNHAGINGGGLSSFYYNEIYIKNSIIADNTDDVVQGDGEYPDIYEYQSEDGYLYS